MFAGIDEEIIRKFAIRRKGGSKILEQCMKMGEEGSYI